MQLLPMDAPAEIYRRDSDAQPTPGDILVARGPLVIMAHGLLSLAPQDRADCWIGCDSAELSPRDAEEALRHWSTPH